MPFKRVLINSLHYWVFFALLNSTELYFFPTGHTYSRTTIAIIFGLWCVFEFMNYKCHKLMGDFRRTPKEKNDKGYENLSKKRLIPYGYGYDLVSSANYFWESLIWISYSILTRNYTAYIFTIFSIKQMTEWALQKHKRYFKEFPDYPKNRKAIFPFIL
jgi:very-long-chain enoyl-CoA reductase